jgi:hypothetical protein
MSTTVLVAAAAALIGSLFAALWLPSKDPDEAVEPTLAEAAEPVAA